VARAACVAPAARTMVHSAVHGRGVLAGAVCPGQAGRLERACCPAERFAAGSRAFVAIQPRGHVLIEVRFSDAHGVTLYVGKRTFLTAMAEIASGKKVRFCAVETMKNLEKNTRKKRGNSSSADERPQLRSDRAIPPARSERAGRASR